MSCILFKYLPSAPFTRLPSAPFTLCRLCVLHKIPTSTCGVPSSMCTMPYKIFSSSKPCDFKKSNTCEPKPFIFSRISGVILRSYVFSPTSFLTTVSVFSSYQSTCFVVGPSVHSSNNSRGRVTTKLANGLRPLSGSRIFFGCSMYSQPITFLNSPST